jgi:hypothetical protein
MPVHSGAAATHFIEASPQLDRRRSERVTAKLRATLSVRGRLLWAKHKAFIVDYSMLGLKVRTGAGLSSGQVVRVASETNPAQPAFCRVVWVGKAGSSPHEGEAGLAFLDFVS